VHPLTADPKFVSISSGFTTGLNSVAGFALQSTSPAINAGLEISGRPNMDYMGNAVPSDGAVDIGAFEFQKSSSSEETNQLIPSTTELKQNYPNPFNPSTIIEFTVKATGYATVEVYSILGARAVTLFQGIAASGKVHTVTFDASTLPTGIYFARLKTGTVSAVKKMLLVK
jgi:hypothetical protein